MSESIRLWYTIIADPKRFNFTNFICVALVSFVRDQIIDGDFACCMQNLQRASENVKDVRLLLDRANEVCATYNREEESYSAINAGSSTYLGMLGKHI